MENNSRPNDALGHLSIEKNWIAIQQLFKCGECTASPDIITVMVHPILLRLLSTNSDLYAMTLGLFQTIRTNCIWVWAFESKQRKLRTEAMVQEVNLCVPQSSRFPDLDFPVPSPLDSFGVIQLFSGDLWDWKEEKYEGVVFLLRRSLFCILMLFVAISIS